jgi:hypothetical protein
VSGSHDDRALHDDDQLLHQLRRALERHDSVPAEALAAARSAAQLGRADELLAELVFDSLLDAGDLVMRSDAAQEARSLGFVSRGHRIDVELLDDGDVVLGQLDPPVPADVELELTDGTQHGVADALGRFRFTGARGPMRLRITGPVQVVLTPWITW